MTNSLETIVVLSALILACHTLTSAFRLVTEPVRPSLNRLLMATAPYKKARTQNAPGNLFVDESCIDCDVCRWMCPSVYARKGIKAAVANQPNTDALKLQAYAAMIACPVGAIRTRIPDPLTKKALEIFPAEIDSANIPGVMHMGYHSEESFGATAYLIKHEEGNIMIDVPRFNTKLAETVELEGGISKIIMTHRDDIAQNEKWKERFPDAQRIIHRIDAYGTAAQSEIMLEGSGTWEPAKGVTIIHTPGHTAGSLCIMVETSRDTVMFTGDTLAYSENRKGLEGFKRYNSGNPEVQSQSMRLLAEEEFPFTWILPGHGRMARFGSLAEKRRSILEAADKFDREDVVDGLYSVGYY